MVKKIIKNVLIDPLKVPRIRMWDTVAIFCKFVFLLYLRKQLSERLHLNIELSVLN